VAAVVVLATVGNAPRIKELMEIARTTRDDASKIEEKKPLSFEEEIEPLFE